MPRMTMYHFEGCPACGDAKRWMNELTKEHPELQKANVELVDVYKTSNFSPPEPFYYVPTFFLDGRKVLEGAVSKEKVERLLRQAM
ncbi:MAG: thioredoxin [Clostridiales bacterium]|nr:thioredoxin [Clostridiales bacterium]